MVRGWLGAANMTASASSTIPSLGNSRRDMTLPASKAGFGQIDLAVCCLHPAHIMASTIAMAPGDKIAAATQMLGYNFDGKILDLGL